MKLGGGEWIAPYAARLASLILGTLANLSLLAACAAKLHDAELAFTLLFLTSIMIVQTVDIGIGTLAVNIFARTVGNPKPARDLAIASILAAVGVSSALIIALWIAGSGPTYDVAPRDWLGIVIAYAILCGVAPLKLSFAKLIAEAKVTKYQIFNLPQPLLLFLVSAWIAWGKPTVGEIAISAALTTLPGALLAYVTVRPSVTLSRENQTSFRRFAAGHLTENVKLAQRQLAALLSFTGLPFAVAFADDPTLAAEFSLGHRIVLAAWTIMSLPASLHWAAMASRLADARDREAGRVLANKVRRETLLVGVILGPAAATIIAVLLLRLDRSSSVSDVTVSAMLFWLLLVTRGLASGNALFVQASARDGAVATLELLGSIVCFTLIVATGAFVERGALIALISVGILYNVLDATLLRRQVAKERS